jgi:hypothetical protein
MTADYDPDENVVSNSAMDELFSSAMNETTASCKGHNGESDKSEDETEASDNLPRPEVVDAVADALAAPRADYEEDHAVAEALLARKEEADYDENAPLGEEEEYASAANVRAVQQKLTEKYASAANVRAVKRELQRMQDEEKYASAANVRAVKRELQRIQDEEKYASAENVRAVQRELQRMQQKRNGPSAREIGGPHAARRIGRTTKASSQIVDMRQFIQ